MHFWVSAARPGVYGQRVWPRKIGTNWFMPAFVKSRFGASGNSELDGTMVCCFSWKKSRKLWRISFEVIGANLMQTCVASVGVQASACPGVIEWKTTLKRELQRYSAAAPGFGMRAPRRNNVGVHA